MSDTTEKELREARADIACLLERCERGDSFHRPRFTGISSTALVRYAITGRQPNPPDNWLAEYPRDADDLASCYRAFERLPPHRKTDEVRAMLTAFTDYVEDRYPGAGGKVLTLIEAEKFAADRKAAADRQTS